MSNRKPQLNVKNFEGRIIDTDLAEYHEEQDNYLSVTTNTHVSQLDKFLSRPDVIAGVKDERTNIFIPGQATYIISPNEIGLFFLLLEQIRRDGLSLIFAEKQDEKSSGIVIDVDIFYKSHITESKLTYDFFQDIVSILMVAIEEFFDLTPLKQVCDKIQIAITKRGRPVSREHNGQTVMSEGFHILIPGIKISRSAKHYLITRLIKTGTFEKRINTALKEFLIEENYSYIDENSRHIPAFFVGCKRDPKKPPYELQVVFNYQFKTDYRNANLSENREIRDSNVNCNIMHEFSLNYEVPSGHIKKRDILCNIKYSGEIDAYSHSNRPQDIEDELKLSGQLSLMNLHDPEFSFIKALLDILDPVRPQDQGPWFEVMVILAGIGERVKPLAEYFCRKCPEQFRKMGISGFESMWNSLVTKSKSLPTGKKKGMGSLIWLARRDNPKRYEEVMKRNILKVINNIAYKRSVSGEFEHADIAEVLYQMFSNKYAADKLPGEKFLSWFEFVLPGEKMDKGEVFKFHKDNNPRSLERYMSEVLVQIFEKIHDDMFDQRYTITNNQTTDNKSQAGDAASQIADPEFERKQKRKLEIQKGLLKTIKNLKKDGFIKSTINRCMVKFEQRGFAAQLDQDDNIMGVGNGVLVFHESGGVEFIQSQHDYKISMFTPVDYEPFNPRKPHTKHLLKAIRSMVKDDEPDTFEFLLCGLASALTGYKKEAFLIFLLGTGREGKSTLMQLWRAVLGQYGRKLPIALLVGMRAKGEAANPAMMDMENKRGCSYQEPDQTDRLNSALAKETTGGEKQTGRGLFQGQREFEPKCIHIIPTNYLVDINTTDDATWRRIKVIRLQIKFFNPNDTKFNPNDPFHRRADPQAEKFDKDPEYLSAFLSILVYYWQVFKIHYDHKLVNIPHPHIEYETAKYRTAKDSIDEFITRRMVRVPERVSPLTQKATQHIERMKDIIDRYVEWMDSQAKWCAKSLIESSLENSKIGKMFDQDRVSKYLKGFKFLRPAETKQPDEAYVFDVSFSDLLGDEYEGKTWKEERESLREKDGCADFSNLLENSKDVVLSKSGNSKQESVADVGLAPKPTDETKAQIISEAIKSGVLSDAAHAAIESEKKLKTIRSETVEEYYNRLCAEYDKGGFANNIEKRNKEIDEIDSQFIKEQLEYQVISRRKEMKATTEAHKQFVIAEKEKNRAIMETMSAPSRMVEMPPVLVFNESNPDLFSPTDLGLPADTIIKASSDFDACVLDADDGFVFE